MSFLNNYNKKTYSINSFVLLDPKVTGFIHLNIVRGFLNCDEMTATLTVDRVESNIQGLMDTPEETQFYNEMVESLGPYMIDENREAISAALTGALRPLLNQVLNQMTLGDLIGLSQTRLVKNDNESPCGYTN